MSCAVAAWATGPVVRWQYLQPRHLDWNPDPPLLAAQVGEVAYPHPLASVIVVLRQGWRDYARGLATRRQAR